MYVVVVKLFELVEFRVYFFSKLHNGRGISGIKCEISVAMTINLTYGRIILVSPRCVIVISFEMNKCVYEISVSNKPYCIPIIIQIILMRFQLELDYTSKERMSEQTLCSMKNCKLLLSMNVFERQNHYIMRIF